MYGGLPCRPGTRGIDEHSGRPTASAPLVGAFGDQEAHHDANARTATRPLLGMGGQSLPRTGWRKPGPAMASHEEDASEGQLTASTGWRSV